MVVSKKTSKTSRTVKKTPSKSSAKTKINRSKVSSDITSMASSAGVSEKVNLSARSSNDGDWRKRFLVPMVIVLLAAIVYIALQQLVVATVNGVPISRLGLVKEMESQIGEQVLDSMITKQLIMQTAKKQGIVVSDEEIEQEITKLKEQFSSSGQDFDAILKMQGVTLERVHEEVRVQKIIEKALAKDVEVTDEEIDEFIESNSAFLPEGQDTSDEAFRLDIVEQLKQQKVGQSMKLWIEELKLNANIKYYGSFKREPTPQPTVPVAMPEEVQE